MPNVSTLGVLANEAPPVGNRLDRPVLVSNLAVGALGLLVLAFMSWPVAVLGAVYVVAASVFLAAVYARETLTRRQEALAWAVPWLLATALWSWIIAASDPGNEGGTSGWLAAVWFGLVIATPSCLAWQLGALAVRATRYGVPVVMTTDSSHENEPEHDQDSEPPTPDGEAPDTDQPGPHPDPPPGE